MFNVKTVQYWCIWKVGWVAHKSVKVCLEKLSLMYKSPLRLYFNMQAIFKVQNVQSCCSAERGDEWPVDAEALASKKPLPWDSLETNTRCNWKPDTYWHGNKMHNCTRWEIVAGGWAVASKQCAATQKNRFTFLDKVCWDIAKNIK